MGLQQKQDQKIQKCRPLDQLLDASTKRKLKVAQGNVDRAQRKVDGFQHDINNKQKELEEATRKAEHCNWFEKPSRSWAVTSTSAQLQALVSAKEIATGYLQSAKHTLQGLEAIVDPIKDAASKP